MTTRMNAYDVGAGGADYLIAADTPETALRLAREDCDNSDVTYTAADCKVVALSEETMHTRLLHDEDTGEKVSVWDMLPSMGDVPAIMTCSEW